MKMPILAVVTLVVLVVMNLSCQTLGLPTEFQTGESDIHREHSPTELSASNGRNCLRWHCGCILLLARCTCCVFEPTTLP